MKATGIVRRVDDLGRIVIPKEIRRTLRIREGDPLEIYTEKDGGVIFRKYSPMGDLQEFAAQMCESIGAATGHIAHGGSGLGGQIPEGQDLLQLAVDTLIQAVCLP